MVIRRFLTVLVILANATGAAFAQDTVALGKGLFLKCSGCHSVVDTKTNIVKKGPHLHDLFGRKPGSLAEYDYSDAMVKFGQDMVWNEITLTKFLHSPSNSVPGTTMVFMGIKKDEEIQAILAYLATFDPNGMATE
jgi:cytochrome c2